MTVVHQNWTYLSLPVLVIITCIFLFLGTFLSDQACFVTSVLYLCLLENASDTAKEVSKKNGN